MDLDSMKYAELRSLAKKLGLKANMKAEKLIMAIKQHYQQEESKGEEREGHEKDATTVQEVKDAQETKEGVSSPAVFVNTRRGKGNRGTKRKICGAAAEPEVPPSAAQGDTAVVASSAPCDVEGAKKRRVSFVKDTDRTEPEPQKEADSIVLQQADVKVTGDSEKAPIVAKAGRIPRYQRLQQKTKPQLKPVTPNFKKLHEAHFNKMESIDSYVQRKTKQMETYRSSVKDQKNLLDKTKQPQIDSKTQERTNPSRASMFSPVLGNKRAAEDKRRHTLLSASKVPPNKPAGKEAAPFRPSVLSTRRINVRFSEATHDNECKRSMVKTPARMSLCRASSTPQKVTADGGKPNGVKTSTFSATKAPGPFVFTGNTSTSTPGTNKKPQFDLKASLSRSLSYKPHTGKLKPFGETKENAAGNKSLISNPHQSNYKQHQVQTREDRRAKQMEGRKQKKEGMLGARRGLVMM